MNHDLEVYRAEFGRLFRIIGGLGMAVFLTTDAIPCSAGVLAASGSRRAALDQWFRELLTNILDAFPEVRGIILRIGESDGTDVCDPLRSRLHLKNSNQTHRFVRDLLPLFESRQRLLGFRTWTVGAHRIGDLIWHRRTLEDTLGGLHSPALLVSMKHGESDFFRYLPLNRAFFSIALGDREIVEIRQTHRFPARSTHAEQASPVAGTGLVIMVGTVAAHRGSAVRQAVGVAARQHRRPRGRTRWWWARG